MSHLKQTNQYKPPLHFWNLSPGILRRKVLYKSRIIFRKRNMFQVVADSAELHPSSHKKSKCTRVAFENYALCRYSKLVYRHTFPQLASPDARRTALTNGQTWLYQLVATKLCPWKEFPLKRTMPLTKTKQNPLMSLPKCQSWNTEINTVLINCFCSLFSAKESVQIAINLQTEVPLWIPHLPIEGGRRRNGNSNITFNSPW